MSEKLKKYEAALDGMQRALDTNDPRLLKEYVQVESKLRKDDPDFRQRLIEYKQRNEAKLSRILEGLSNGDGTLAHTPEQEEEAMIRLTKIWKEIDNES